MKHCPKCNADYFDNMLEFCLEDGTRLADTVETKVSPASADRSNVTAVDTRAARTERVVGRNRRDPVAAG